VIRVTPDTPFVLGMDPVNRDFFVKLPTSRCTFSALGYRQRIRVEVSQHVCAQDCLDQTVIKALLLKGITQKQLATPIFTFRFFWLSRGSIRVYTEFASGIAEG
jgi:hypothetical protein